MHRTKTKGYKKPGECIEPRLRVINPPGEMHRTKTKGYKNQENA